MKYKNPNLKDQMKRVHYRLEKIFIAYDLYMQVVANYEVTITKIISDEPGFHPLGMAIDSRTKDMTFQQKALAYQFWLNVYISSVDGNKTVNAQIQTIYFDKPNPEGGVSAEHFHHELGDGKPVIKEV